MAASLKTYETNFILLSATKGKTTRNTTYYTIEALDKTTGEIVVASYFGNTRPKAVVAIEPYTTKGGDTYNIAQIQPHQSRNKFGRFISARR